MFIGQHVAAEIAATSFEKAERKMRWLDVAACWPVHFF